MEGTLGSLLLFALLSSSATAWVARLSQPGPPPAPWRMIKYSNERPTRYVVAGVAGRLAIQATVDSSMSLLARPITVDLTATPILCWRWFVDAPVRNADMAKKRGDDYAARVYIAFDMPDSALTGSTRLRLRMARGLFGKEVPDAAVVYVWDNKHAVGTASKSSYTDRSQLIVAETGGGRAGSWVSERADLARDFAKAFAGHAGRPVQLAVASDGDNTKSKGRAAFADIHFVARGQPCAF
jgi:hypothetical protein